MKKFFLVTVLIFSSQILAFAAEIPPAPNNIYVADYAEMIDTETKEKILEMGRALDEKYKAQIAVVTIKTLDNSNLEEYANELFNKWGLGDKELNNGVLLLIAKDDRRFRIEVGYGLESTITNEYAGEILDGMTSYFREENYSAGILQAYSTLTKKVYKEYEEKNPDEVEENTFSDILVYCLAVIVVIRMIAIIWTILALIVAIALYICNLLIYVVTMGNYGTLNYNPIFNFVEKYSGLNKFLGGKGIFGIFGGRNGGGGGHSGGGGASGGW